jgi:hypothetical protein
MVEQRELRIPVNETTRVVIECKCGVEISIDMGKQGETVWKEKSLECLVCHGKFDSSLRNALYYFTLWLAHLATSGEKVSLRINPN